MIELSCCEAIAQRHSTRRYLNRQLDRSVIEKILEAGLRAPSAKNRQPWRFLVVLDGKSRLAIAKAMFASAEKMISKYEGGSKEKINIGSLAESAVAVAEASCIILVRYTCDESWSRGRERTWSLDISDIEAVDILGVGACMENMTLEATALGIGSLWNCDVLYAQEELARMFGYEDQLISALILGYEDAGEIRPRTPRKLLSDLCIWV